MRDYLLHIVFASTSGHTEHVVDVLIDSLKRVAPGWRIREAVAEKSKPADLLIGDILLLASATWNSDGVEGQLNPRMQLLLRDEANDIDLESKPCACIALGDDRYFYTARAADHLQQYVSSHHGDLILPTLKVINEPYGQEEAVRVWAKRLVDASDCASGP